MRKNNCKNYNDKYEVKIYRSLSSEDDREILCILKCSSYKDIVQKVPILKNEENIRNYFRKYKENGCKYKSSYNKFHNIEINKITQTTTTLLV